MTETEDGELVARAREGSLEAYGELVRRHQARVRGLCAAVLREAADADDAAQDVFVKAHRSLRDFQGDARFSTWLYRVAVNHCIDLRRRRARTRLVSFDALFERADARVEALAEAPPPADAGGELGRVRELIDRLPDSQRDALLLRARDLSYADIARALKCTEESVRARLRRGRRRLAEWMRAPEILDDAAPARTQGGA